MVLYYCMKRNLGNMSLLTKRKYVKAFSLVEVVVAMAVFIVAGFALIGLLGAGLKSNSDSKQQLQAATIAEMLCSTRRASPSATILDANGNGFALPPITSATNNLSATTPTYLTWDGLTTNQATGARFGLLYNVVPSTNYVASLKPGVATVYLCLYWPALANATNTANGHFELTSTFALP